MKALLSLKHKLVGGPSELIKERWPDGTEMEMNGKPFTFVPYDLTNVFLLKQLGVEAPSPILHDYDWPGPYTPFDIQKKTAAHLTMHPSAYVLNELGTGKTRAVLWAWDYLASIGGTGRLLIVDDHPVFRRGISQFLSSQEGLTVCAEAENAPRLRNYGLTPPIFRLNPTAAPR